MSRRPKVLAIIQAGGKGSRMDVLTRERAKPALPFGGHYQLIDIALSNVANSGITDVWVSVQYQAGSLARHLAGGRPWDLDRTRGGFRWLMPQEGDVGSQSGFAAGNADDLQRKRDQIERFGADVIVVMSADHLFALDLGPVIEQHLDRGSRCTIVTTEVTRSQAKAKAVVSTDAAGAATRLDYKPTRPSGTTIACEIFLYSPAALLDTLGTLRAELAAGPDTDHSDLGDFGEHLLPRLIEGGGVDSYALSGYWRDLGTPSDYLTAHRDLIAGRIGFLDDDEWPMLSRFPELPAARIRRGGSVEQSVVSAGADIAGTVRRSTIGPGVRVDAGAVVEDSVIFARSHVEAGAQLRHTVLDAHGSIGRSARIGAATKATRISDGHLVLIGKGSRVGDGQELVPGSRLEPGTTV